MADSTTNTTGTKTTSSSFSRAPIQPAQILAQFAATLPATQTALVNATEQEVAARQAADQQTVAAGGAQAEGIRAKGEADALERQKAVDIFKMFNGSDDAVVAAHEQRARAKQTMDSLRPVIDAEDQVAWWDDPLRWIGNQFTQPLRKQAYNAASRTAKIKTVEIDEIHRNASQRQAIDLAPTSDLIKKTADSIAAATANTASAKANELQAGAAAATAQAAMQFFAMNKTLTDTQMGVARMLADREMTSAQLAIHNDQVSRMKKEEQETLDILHNVNVKQVALGQPKFKLGEWKQLNPAMKTELMMNSRNLSSIGGGTADTIEQIYLRNASGTVAGTLPALNRFLTEQLSGPTATKIKDELSQNDAFKKLSTDKQQVLIAQQLEARQAKERSNPFANEWSVDNPGRLNFARVQQRPELQNNSFVKEMQRVQAVDSRATFQDKDILLHAEGLVRANPKDIPRIAKELQEFYKVGLLTQWRDDGAMWAGLPVQEKYGISASGRYVDPTGVTRGLLVTDLPTVEHYLTYQASRRDIRGTPFTVLEPNTLVEPKGMK